MITVFPVNGMLLMLDITTIAGKLSREGGGGGGEEVEKRRCSFAPSRKETLESILPDKGFESVKNC